MRTIYATGGYSDALVVDLEGGSDLTGATFRLAILPELVEVPPAVGDAAWKTVTAQPGGTITTELRILVTAATPPGHYHLWLQVTVGATIVPTLVLDSEGLPLLVRVV